MKDKLHILLVILILTSLNSLSQNEIYLDENLEQIEKVKFQNRCKTQVLRCLRYYNDTLIVNKVLHKYKFGKLEDNEYQQLKLFLEDKANSKINNNKTIVISYADTITTAKEKKLRYDKHVNECKAQNPKAIHADRSFNYYKSMQERWIKNKNKCIKKIEKKYNSKVFYIYKYNIDNAAATFLNFKWIKDQGAFRHKFFKIIYSYNFLIIKPNGEYFLSGNYISDSQLKGLLKANNWDKYKEDLKKSLTKNKLNGTGLFSSSKSFHTKHCF